MLAVLVLFVAVIQGAISQCPKIGDGGSNVNPVGSTLELKCPGSTSLTYFVTCMNGNVWDHSNLAISCSGSVAPAPTVNVPAATAPPAPFPSPTPAATAAPMPPKTCPYIVGFMRAVDGDRIYSEGAVYQMICSNNGGRFPATCRNGAWVYRVNACTGIVQSTAAPTPSVIPPGPTSTGIPAVTCPYLAGYMVESDASITFRQGDRYELACYPNKSQRFTATCNNGVWYGNQRSCTGTTGGLGGFFNRQATTVSRVPGKLCDHMSGQMLDTDAGKTFADGTQYRLRCVDQGSVASTVLATCVDGTWSYDPNACFSSPSTIQSGIQIGNTNIPIWFFLLGNQG